MKKIGLLILLTSISYTCSKSDEAPSDPNKILYPVSLSRPGYRLELIYDDQNRIIQRNLSPTQGGSITTYKLTYNSAGKVSESSELTSKYVYIYTNDVIARTEEYYQTSLSWIHEFKYDDKLRVIERISYTVTSNLKSTNPYRRIRYTYDSGDNVTISKSELFGIEYYPELTLYYSGFDNKKNSDVFFDIDPLNPTQILFKNNPSGLDKSSPAKSDNESYVYFFNEQNYVTRKLTTKNSNDGGTTNYSYR